jgi:heme oxygenase
MSMSQSARQILRLATAPYHERVDRAFGAFVLSDANQYGAFLRAQAFALLPVEAAIEESEVMSVLPDWPARRRSHLLRMDLAEMGLMPEVGAQWAPFDGVGELLGAIYVLEGSRLGGGLMARSVPAHFPCRFLTDIHSGRWRHLIEVLDRLLTSEDRRADAIGAARRVFACFEDGARRQSGTL